MTGPFGSTLVRAAETLACLRVIPVCLAPTKAHQEGKVSLVGRSK